MGKGVFEGLTEVVPGAVASGGLGSKPSSGGKRADHPLGKEGADLLAGVPLFSGLSRRHLRRLAEHADVTSFHPKEVIVKEGQPGGTFYVIVEGEARVSQGSRAIGTLGPGDFFGEISLLDGGPRTADVVALTRVRAIRIFKRTFDGLVSEEPVVAAKVLAVVAGRLREADHRSLSR